MITTSNGFLLMKRIDDKIRIYRQGLERGGEEGCWGKVSIKSVSCLEPRPSDGTLYVLGDDYNLDDRESICSIGFQNKVLNTIIFGRYTHKRHADMISEISL